jgi:CRISPR/Cas system CMR-associated protein Cmr5 small subunit
MMETSEDRCLRWDKLISEKKYAKVVKEFDSMIATRGHLLTVGDLVKRDEALEKMGVISFTKERAKKMEEMERESRRGKY